MGLHSGWVGGRGKVSLLFQPKSGQRGGGVLPRLVLPSFLLVFLAGCAGGGSTTTVPPPPPPPPPTTVPFRVETVVANAAFPVVMAFAPDGRMFYNELRTGNIRVVQNGALLAQPLATLVVETSGERGLLGLALDPQFAANRRVYVLHSDPAGKHRIVRFTEANNTGSNLTVMVDNLPSAVVHNGGNIAFGPDGMLYVTLGDATVPANSQDRDSLSGKILRYDVSTAPATVPPNNPFGAGNPAFNLGLRNSFDFTFHPQSGIIYASENGPNCDDEINRIVAGANYGWRPNYPCGDNDPQYRAPIMRFTPPIAPTGITFYTAAVFPQFTGNLFLVDFNQGRVRRFVVDEAAMGEILFSEVVVDGGFGPLLDILPGPGGNIYFSSANGIHRIVPQ